MAGLTVQNFLSAASGIAVIFALTRAFARQNVSTLGNARVDVTRITLWITVPVALIIALFFIQQGTLQNLLPYTPYTSLEGAGNSCLWGQWRRRKRSRCWAPTAAASSTPTHHIRLKTQRH